MPGTTKGNTERRAVFLRSLRTLCRVWGFGGSPIALRRNIFIAIESQCYFVSSVAVCGRLGQCVAGRQTDRRIQEILYWCEVCAKWQRIGIAKLQFNNLGQFLILLLFHCSDL
jgi:hypothetical protein